MKNLLFISILLVISVSLESKERVFIDVGKGNVKKSLIALPALQYFGSSKIKHHVALGHNLYSTIKNDLDVSSMFEFMDPKAFLEDSRKVGLRPAPQFPNGFKFSNWEPQETEFLLKAGYKIINGVLELETYFYYVPQAKLIFNKKYRGSLKSYRRVAHTFTSDLVQKLTNRTAMFNSKMTFVSDRHRRGQKEVYIMDWDGHNIFKVSNHRGITISPNWSRDGSKIAYSTYTFHKKAKRRNIDLFIYDLVSRRRFLASYRKGINSGGNFFPGDKKMALSISSNNNPNIFTLNLTGPKRLVQLTNGPSGAMNVEPAVSPDGKYIAFSSDRDGRPNIYIVSVNGGKPRKVTFAGKYNSSPSWHPDGKSLAYAGYENGYFDIFTINIDGTGIKRLTSAKKPNGRRASNEDPSWSPDGRYIAYSSNRTGNHQLFFVQSDGTNERRISYDKKNYYKPKWSPFLK